MVHLMLGMDSRHPKFCDRLLPMTLSIILYACKQCTMNYKVEFWNRQTYGLGMALLANPNPDHNPPIMKLYQW